MHRLLLHFGLAATLLLAPMAREAGAQQYGAGAVAIGRIAQASGPLLVRTGQGGWVALPPGAGLVPGQAVRTGARTQADIELGADRIGLDPDTILRLDGASPGGFAATLEQGRAMLLVRGLQPGQTVQVAIPRASVTLGQPGLYVIDTGDAVRPATIGTSRGLAQVFGPGVSLAVPPGATAVLPFGGQPGLRAGVAEGFLADDPLPAVPLPGVVTPSPGYVPGGPPDLATIPGGEALLGEGEWGASPQYGSVWYPPMAPGWNPYADSWAGAGPWGYAPWFLGTWVLVGPRWGWVQPPPAWRRPGYYPPPPPGGRPPPAYAQPGRPPPAFAPPMNLAPYAGGVPPTLGGRPVPPFAGGAFPPGGPPPRGGMAPLPSIGGVPVDRRPPVIPPSIGGAPVPPPRGAPPPQPPPMRAAQPRAPAPQPPMMVAPPRGQGAAPPQAMPPPRPMAPPPQRQPPPPQRRCSPGQAC